MGIKIQTSIKLEKNTQKQYPDLELSPINYLLSTGMLAYRTVCHFLNSIKHEQEQYAFNTILWNQLCVNENPPKFMIPMIAFTSKVWGLKSEIWNIQYLAPSPKPLLAFREKNITAYSSSKNHNR